MTSSDEILRIVFLLLGPTDLAICTTVCKQWRRIAQEDFLWKGLCAIEWPSTCKSRTPPTETYHKLFTSFYKRKAFPRRTRTLVPPRISFDDLEFFIDVWVDEELLFSKVVDGPVLRKGSWVPPPGTSQALRYHIEGPRYKMVLPVEPRFEVPFTRPFYVSVLVSRKDTKKVACIVDKSRFQYFEEAAHRAVAFDYPVFSLKYPFVPRIRAWISLFFIEHVYGDIMEVYSIMMDFCDATNSEEEVLWLLDMLDWK